MGVSKMYLGGQESRIIDNNTYPFCREFREGVMLGVYQGLYLFTKGDTIRQTGFPDARESWEVCKGISEFNKFIEDALKLGNFEISNIGIPSLMALSYVVEALENYGGTLESILDSDALSSFITKVFPAVKFDNKAMMNTFTTNQLVSPDYTIHDYKQDKVRCGVESWGALRFAGRHVGFQYEIAGKTYTTEVILRYAPYLTGDDGEEIITMNRWMTFFWKRLYIMVLWDVGIYSGFTWRKEDKSVFDVFKYRSPMGVVPIKRVRPRQELEEALDDRLVWY